MTLHWGILGSGRIAHTFAGALATTASGTLVAVAARDGERAAQFAAEVNAADDVHAHAGYDALLADPGVDAVYVATPHSHHAEWTIRALEAGKHVLVEKPMGLNHAETMAMVDTAQQSGRLLMEAFMYRVHPQTRRLVELVRDGAIGELRHVSAAFGYHATFAPAGRLFANTLAGGAVLDVGCYPVSMARLLLDAEPSRIRAHGHLGTTGVDEWSAAQLEFEGGATAQVATAISLNLDNSVRVFGSRGHIEVPNPWLCADADGNWAFTLHPHGRDPELISGTSDPLFALEAEHVARLVESGRSASPLVSWEDSLGNAIALDTWRNEIGLTYVLETPARHRGRLRSAPRREAPLAAGRIRHLDKPVSRLVMGCDNQPGMSHAAVMWDHFVDLGGNCFDTAHIYGGGLMETLLGHWHTQRNLRDDIVIVGKGAHTPHDHPEHVAPQLTESLDRLQTDHVDVYFLHRDNTAVPVGEFVEALNAELSAGRIRTFGGSNWTLERVRAANDYAAQHGLQGFSAVSNNFSLARMMNPLWPGVQTATGEAWRDYLTSAGLALMPWSSQARGFFTPWVDEVLAHAATRRLAHTGVTPSVAELQHTWFSPENFARRARAGELAGARGVAMIEVALAYVVGQPFECFPLIGPRTLRETRSSLQALTLELSAEELRWLDAGD